MLEIRTLLANDENHGGQREEKIEYIVMHYTANDGDIARNNALYFSNNVVKVSAHYFVDDNNIYQSVLDDVVAYHCGAKSYIHPFCRNNNSIGIEMCDNIKDGKRELTEKTFKNASDLAASLCIKYDIPIENIIRHYDVTGKLCPAYWIDNDGIEVFRKEVRKIIMRRNHHPCI